MAVTISVMMELNLPENALKGQTFSTRRVRAATIAGGLIDAGRLGAGAGEAGPAKKKGRRPWAVAPE